MTEERRTRRGANHPNARFTPEQVQALRERYQREHTPIRQLANEAGCSYGTMQKLLAGERYANGFS